MLREYDVPRERHTSIEKPDIELIYKDPPKDSGLLNVETPIGKKYKLAKELCEDTRKVDEEDKSESPTRKPKKIHCKPDKPTVAKVQKKL